MNKILHQLAAEHTLDRASLIALLACDMPEFDTELFALARDARHATYGHDVYVRALIEFTNYCRCDCLYCGIRRSNAHAERYRLSKADILECWAEAHSIGFRTFVMQGGEDMHFTDDIICDIVAEIKRAYPDSAVTLSIGERTRASYRRFRDAGADRYLLRHEAANPELYGALHPPEQRLEHRMRCLSDLKELGYQVGAGFMVGAPGQTLDMVADDIEFLKSFAPDMIGVGPFIPHHDTPLGDCAAGSCALTLRIIAILRLMLPDALIPSTTALATVSDDGRERGILAGANVVMPNFTPMHERGKYLLYNNKRILGSESGSGLDELSRSMERIGYHIVTSRGDRHGLNI